MQQKFMAFRVVSKHTHTHIYIYFLRHDPIILNRRTLQKFGVSHFYVNLPKNNCETVKYVMEALPPSLKLVCHSHTQVN